MRATGKPVKATDAPRHDDARRIVDDLESKVARDADVDEADAASDDLRPAVPGSEEPPD